MAEDEQMTNRVVIPSRKKREQNHAASRQADLRMIFQVSDRIEHGVELVALSVLVQCWVVLVPGQFFAETMVKMSYRLWDPQKA
jgi:hypothetical protein